MKNQGMFYGVIGLIVGIVITGFVMSASQTTMKKEDIQTKGKISMTLDNMVNELKGRAGDNFDKAFIEEMITHHKGAVDMAKLAQTQAKHDEIKKLADDIIAAQTKEIGQMQKWQKDWGYERR